MANPYHGILTLDNQQKSTSTHNGVSVSRGPGRPPNIDLSSVKVVDPLQDLDDQSKIASTKNNRIQRIGATFAIKAICVKFAADLKTKIPTLWSIADKIQHLVPDEINLLQMKRIDYTVANELVTCLQLIEIMSPHVHKDLHSSLFNLLPHLTMLLRHPLKAIRHMSSRCLATLALIDPTVVMSVIVDRGIALLHVIERSIDRQGAAEAIACIVNKLQFKIVPYVILLVVPLLGNY